MRETVTYGSEGAGRACFLPTRPPDGAAVTVSPEYKV